MRKNNIIKFSKIKKAFSLIELSVVILIIGIIVASIIGGKKLVTLSNLSKARALTNSAPVAGIESLVAWYDTTSKDSFLIKPVDGTTISTWKDINPQSNVKRDAVAGNAPTYTENAINGLPALKFNGSTNYLENVANNMVNSNQLSVFFVMSRLSFAASNNSGWLSIWTTGQTQDFDNGGSIAFYDGGNTTANQSLSFNRCFGCGGAFDANQSSSHPGNNKAIIFSTIFDGANNNSYIYGAAGINGAATVFTNPTSTSGVFNIQNIRIGARQSAGAVGNFWNGYIGEIIIYDRGLSDFERGQVEQYLAKKWGIKLT
jgi:prepilin-type N-terminal cleavage/methylation domain-containing protein